jgi:hypothetical protein
MRQRGSDSAAVLADCSARQQGDRLRGLSIEISSLRVGSEWGFAAPCR